jgi:predicted RND superfamily exporter protein
MLLKYRKPILVLYSVLALLSVYGAFNLKFRFDFEQFFPEGDEDLAFYQKFIKSFENDNNFILIGIPNEPSVFQKDFLEKVRKSTNELKNIEIILKSQSLTTLRYPIKTPFGMTSKPLINIKDISRYEDDKKNILGDPRFVGSLINEDASAMIIALKTKYDPDIYQSQSLIEQIEKILKSNQITTYHILGRANFQYEIMRIQQWEFLFCTLISLLLVTLVIKILYHRWIIVFITLGCVFASLLGFVGTLSIFGRELSLMSALYPVIILIVSTSDIVHIMTKYLDELKKENSTTESIRITIKEVGISTFITSLTTSIGFLALITSRIAPVRDFGINCAVGVMLAFFITVPLVLILLSYFKKEDLFNPKGTSPIWENILNTMYTSTLSRSKVIIFITFILLGFSIFGITNISTNYSIKKNIPLSEKVGKDFLFFEENFNGFRPLEFAITAKQKDVEDYSIALEIDKLENHLSATPNVGNVISPVTLQKSYYRIQNDNVNDSFKLPPTEDLYLSQLSVLNRLSNTENNILISKDKKQARISSRVLDIGADSIKALSSEIDVWIKSNIDSNIIEVRQTGTGLILDKNSIYVKESLLWGLLFSVILVSVIMAILLKDWKILFIALIPNIVPLIFIGGLLGWLNIELEAGISIIFGVVFGIVVDDTIHFFGRYKIVKDQHKDIEKSIKITFMETGKAIIFTTIILFLAFLVMLFTAQPLTKVVGLLLSVTFIVAVLCDLYLIPILLRKLS